MQTEQTTQPIPSSAEQADEMLDFNPTDPVIREVRSIRIKRAPIYHVEDGMLIEARPGAILPLRAATRPAACLDQINTFVVPAQEAHALLMNGLAEVAEYED